jgi:hypothetical protein
MQPNAPPQHVKLFLAFRDVGAWHIEKLRRPFRERKTFERAQHERQKKENKGTKTQNETQRGAVYGS